jgi:ribosome-associated toxin RatA of RatAB toxin-antitoxin module
VAEAQHRQIVDVPLKKLYQAILDFEQYPRFATGVKQAQVLEKSNQATVVQMQVEMMKKIEYSISVQSEYSDEKAKVWWNLKEGDFFQKNDGLWELSSVGPEKTQVTYKLDLEFSVNVPSFILKGLIKTSLPKAVEDFTAEAKRRET